MMNLVKSRAGNCRWMCKEVFRASGRVFSTGSHRQMAFFMGSPPAQGLLPKVTSCVSLRNYCSSTMKVATYEEVKELCNHPEKLLIDVREPNELLETGSIPTSINIPLSSVEASLKMSNEDFKAKFGRDKPSKEQEVMFNCRSGGRAGKATDIATALGYVNAKNYKGSWTEWAAKEGLPAPK